MRRSDGVSLFVRQQPQQALVTSEHKEKTRKAIDPPPIVQLKVKNNPSDSGHWLVNPFLFMTVILVEAEPTNGVYNKVPGTSLIGSTVSSLHRLKDTDGRDGGFFVFGDISCRRLGFYRLQFNLFDFEKNSGHVIYVQSDVSERFQVVTSKDFRGQMESTALSRTFSDQGVRLRLRKEQRQITGSKRGFDSSPHQSSRSSISYNTFVRPLHDQYGMNPAKRQRSESEYSSQIFQPPQLASSPMYPYGNGLQNGSHALAVQTQPNLSAYSGATYGSLLSQSHIQPTSWQRSIHQEPMSAPASGNPYFSSLNAVPSNQRAETFPHHTQQQNHQYRPRTTEDQSNTLGDFSISSSLSDTALSSHPSQDYLPSNADLQGHSTDLSIGHSSYAVQPQQSPASNHSQYGLRIGMPNPSIPSYETRVQPIANSGSHELQLQSRGAGHYNQGPYIGGDFYPESSTATLSSGTAHLSDSGLSLDSGILNREFMPPYSQHHSPEQSIPDYKRHSVSDATRSVYAPRDSRDVDFLHVP